MAEAPTPEDIKNSEEYRRESARLISEMSSLSAQMRNQIVAVKMIEKSFNLYNKSIIGVVTGFTRAIATYKRMDLEQQKELRIIQLKIKLENERINLLDKKNKLDSDEMRLTQRRLAILQEQEKQLNQGTKLEKLAAAADVLGTAINNAVGSVRVMQQRFGIVTSQAASLQLGDIRQSLASFTKALFTGSMGVGTEDIASAREAYQNQFGGLLTSKAAQRLANEAKTLGISAEQMMTTRRVFMTNTLGDVGRAQALQNRFVEEFKKKGLTSKEAMQSIAQNSELLARNGARFADGFARALADAKKIGVEMSSITQFGDSIIENYEGFLEKSAELGALGIGFDTSRLAEIAVSGDDTALAIELNRQLQAQGMQLQNLSRPQQLGIMSFTGMSMSEILRRAGVAQGGGEETETIEEKNSNFFERMVNALEPLGKIISGIAASLFTTNLILSSIAVNTGGVGNILSMFGGAGGITKLGRLGLGGAGLAIGAGGGTMLGTMLGAKPSTALAGSLVGGLLGLLAALILAPTTAGMSLLLPLLGAVGGGVTSGLLFGNDVVSKPGYGKRKLLTERGAVSLNNRDTIVAYADDMVSNQNGISLHSLGALSTGSKGSVSGIGPRILPYGPLWHQMDQLRLRATLSNPMLIPSTQPRPNFISQRYIDKPYPGILSEPSRQIYMDPRHLDPRVLARLKYTTENGIMEIDQEASRNAGAVENYPGQYEDFKVDGQVFTRIAAGMIDPKKEEETIRKFNRFFTMIRGVGAAGNVLANTINYQAIQSRLANPTISWFMQAAVDRTKNNENPFTERDLTQGQLADIRSMIQEDPTFAKTGETDMRFQGPPWSLVFGAAHIKRNSDGSITLKDTYDFNNYERLYKMTTGYNQLYHAAGNQILWGQGADGQFAQSRIGRKTLWPEAPYVSEVPDLFASALYSALEGQISPDKFSQEMAWYGRRALPSGVRGVPVSIRIPATQEYHNGGIVGSTNEIPAILKKGEAVFTEPQYQRVQEMADLAMMMGATGTTSAPTPSNTEVKIDTTRLEQTMVQLLNAFNGFQINMDGNRISRILNTTTQAATRIGVLEQQNIAVTNR